MKDNKSAILLVRVSTIKQDLDSQILDLKKYAINKGYSNFKIIETKETGYKDIDHKKGVKDMQSFIKENPEYNTVFITELSRYGRRQSVLHKIREWHEREKVQLIIKDDNWQLFNSEGRLNDTIIFSLYANFSEREMKNRLDRFARKKRELMSLGYSFGGKILFGYKLERLPNGKNKIVKDKKSAEIVMNIYNWYLNGLDDDQNPSIRKISLHCIKLGYPKYTHSKRNVNKLLKEKGYTGEKTTNNRRKNKMYGIIKGEPEYIITSNKLIYDRIITDELYYNVQSKLKYARIDTTRATKRTIILSRLIYCPECGRALGGNNRLKNNYDKSSYRCTSRTDTKRCNLAGKSYPMTLIDSVLWSYVKNNDINLGKAIINNSSNEELDNLKKQRNNLNIRIDELNNRLDSSIKILKRINSYHVKLVDDLIDTHTDKTNRLTSEINSLNNELVAIENKISSINLTNEGIDTIWSNIVSAGRSRTDIKKYIKLFVQRIDIILHSKVYTCLKILNKDNSSFHLLIDKTITRSPKVYGCHSLPIDYNWDSININDWTRQGYKKLKESALK